MSNLLESIDKCVKCGACKSGCPVFDVLRHESAGARGKLALIGANLKAELSSSEAYEKS
ncbi:MAG: (Fe-S)-binding protein, partial [Deltaproteobacteria bacterium]|nr:(Fe-S)-binding protein [Deltaproteobacteria bacterium]